MKKNETTLKFTNKWSHIKDANSHFSGQCKNLIKKKLMIHYHILKLFTFLKKKFIYHLVLIKDI